MTLFALDKATVRYGEQTVLSEISLSIERGEKISLIGQSGAGKSTLLTQLYESTDADIAIVPQELGLVRTLSVFHNVYMGRLHRYSTCYNLINLIKPLQAEKDQIIPILEQLGMEEKLFAPVHELSGGQQQRTAIGRAIFKDSATFFGDEPVSALDEHQSHIVMQAIVANHDTVVLSMHDVSLALEYSDRIIGLKDGQKVMDQPTSGMKASDLDGIYRQ